MLTKRLVLVTWSGFCAIAVLVVWFLIGIDQTYQGSQFEYNLASNQTFSTSGVVTLTAASDGHFIIFGPQDQVMESRFATPVLGSSEERHVTEAMQVLTGTFKFNDTAPILSRQIFVKVEAENPVKITVHDNSVGAFFKYASLIAFALVVAIGGNLLINYLAKKFSAKPGKA